MKNPNYFVCETSDRHHQQQQHRQTMKMSQHHLTNAKDEFKHSTQTESQCNSLNQFSRTSRRSYNKDDSQCHQATSSSNLTSLESFKCRCKHQSPSTRGIQHTTDCPKSQQRQCQQQQQQQWWLLFTMSIVTGLVLVEIYVPMVNADAVAADVLNITTHNPLSVNITTVDDSKSNRTTTFLPLPPIHKADEEEEEESTTNSSWLKNATTTTSKHSTKKLKDKFNPEDSIFLRFAKRFTDDNNLVSGIIQDCYRKPTFSCFQKNVYIYLNDVLDMQDVNVTQKVKFFKNQNAFQYDAREAETHDDAAEDDVGLKPTESSLAQDSMEQENEIPRDGRSITAPLAAETPIEEVTNALYGKSMKFAMTHDVELKLPEMMFDGATFRISPRTIEGNGVIAKLELIPKKVNEARLAGKILMKKLQKILKSKLLLSFLALILIIKIIKIKLFWLLPLIIGVGAAKKLLLKFLLFLFPALSHLFKLCSYYQQTYHSTKYHHHHHHINHHHTVIPPWQSAENPIHVPEHIISHPPKGHVSAILHGAPIHEHYGPIVHEPYGAHSQSHEHFENAWENSGPGLGTEYISDINRSAQLDENTNFFQPHLNDANELHTWGLGTSPMPKPSSTQQKKRPPSPSQQQQQQQKLSASLQKPPLQPQNYQKPFATSQIINPFLKQGDKQSFFHSKYKNTLPLQSAPSPVYTPVRQVSLPPLQQHQLKQQQIQGALSAAAQIAAQYDPIRNQPQLQQQQIKIYGPGIQQELTPELKEALRIQTEQRIVQQQQQILEKQPFVQDGQPLMPLNYDPFYSPILLKIDKIIEQLGIRDDTCKERVVCSMYKDPERYSPHSNFVSAELSRDTNELQPVTSTNGAVLRFFRLIQAARDGQDQKNCLALYPECTVNTE